MTRQRSPNAWPSSTRRTLFAGALSIGLLGWLAAAATTRIRQEPPTGPATKPLRPEEQQLVDVLRAEQVRLDPRRALCWIPVDVCIRDELLEYRLVGPAGASHEALLQTPVRAIASRIALGAGAEDLGSRVDLDNARVASAAAFDPFRNYLFVALETSREVALLDAQGRYEILGEQHPHAAL